MYFCCYNWQSREGKDTQNDRIHYASRTHNHNYHVGTRTQHHQHPHTHNPPRHGTKSFANIANYPVAPFTASEQVVRLSKQSVEKLIGFRPDLLLVSAGFDAYARDPLLQLTLEPEDFAQFGNWLRNIEIPVAVVL